MVVDNDLDVVIGVVDDDICYAVYVFAVRHDGLLLASWPCHVSCMNFLLL
jgi:hypothetical protein